MRSRQGWDEAQARSIVEALQQAEGAMLPILHALQDAFGYIDARAVDLIASALNLSRAEVHGTISFYHDFKKRPRVGRTIKLCRAEACQARGAERLVAHLEAERGLRPDDERDGPVTVETVYCLGNCALGPNALVEGELIGRLDEKKLDDLCAGGSRP